MIENGLGKELSPADLEDAPLSSFPDLTGENGESTIKCNKKQVFVNFNFLNGESIFKISRKQVFIKTKQTCS